MGKKDTTDAKSSTIDRVTLGKRSKDELSLVDFISAYSYDEDYQAFVMADGSMGVAFESDIIQAASIEDSDLYDMANAIAVALSSGTRSGMTGQMIVLQTKDVSQELEAYQRYGGTSNPILATSEQIKVDFTKHLLTNSPFTQGAGGGAPFFVKRIKIIWTLMLRPDEKVGGVWKSLKDAISSSTQSEGKDGMDPEGKRFYAYRKRLGEILDQSRRRIINTVQRFTDVKNIDAQRLLYVYRSMLYPVTGGTMTHVWDTQVPLNVQIPMKPIFVNPKDGYILSENHYHKAISLGEIPDYSMVGMCSLPNPNLNWLTLFDYLTNGWMVINFEAMAQNYMRAYTEKRLRFARGGMAMDAKIPYLIQDCELAQHYIEQEKRRFFKVSLSACLFHRDLEQLDKECESVRDKFQEMGLEARIEGSVGPTILMQDLPFNFGPALDEMKRSFLMPDRALADMLPLYGNGRGFKPGRIGGPLMLYNRSGEPLFIDTFQCTNPHMIAAGGSGSGKSFSICTLAADFLRQKDAQVIFVDKGRSYASFTNMLGPDGSYNNLGLSQKTCINGFAGTYEMCSAFLKRLLSHLACPTGNDADMLTGQQLGRIEQCMIRAFEAKRVPQDYRLYSELSSKDPRIKTWVDNAVKRFEIKALDDLTLGNVMQLKASETGRTPIFDIYNICYLYSRKYFDNRRKEHIDESFNSRSSIPEATVKYLAGRSVRVEEMVDESGNTRVVGLFNNPSVAQALEMDGFTLELVDNVQVLEVGHPDDFRQLQESGVYFLVSDDFFEKKLEDLRAEVRATPRFANADEEAVEELARDMMADVDLMEYFEHVPGHAVIQNEVFFSDLINQMIEADDPELNAIIPRFAPYYGDGAFAGFFDGTTGFSIKGKKVVTFELQELASAGDHLLAAVMSLLLQMVILYGQEGDNAKNRKWLIIDEAWELMASPTVSRSIVNLYRTARKFGLSCTLISQSILDFTGSEDGRAVMTNAATRLILRQTKEAIGQFDEILKMTPKQQALMSTVNTFPGYYSEIYVQCTEKGINDVARLVPTPYFYWMATTNPEDKGLRERTRKEIKAETGLDDTTCLDRAMRYLAEYYPKGAQHGKVK